MITLGLYPLILFINHKLEAEEKGVQVNLFRNILDCLKEAGAYLMQSRLVTLIIIFCVSSSILIGRLFYLQIVKGSDYLENYEYSIRRTTSVAATRGNIYDRNGNLLAYNQLAYSVTINLSTVENSITTDKRSEKCGIK